MRRALPARRVLGALALVAVIIMGMGLGVRSAAAHRANAAVTTIEWNERTGNLEIIHRLHAHDAQVAVSDVMGVHPPDLTELKPRAALALYVSRDFSMQNADGRRLRQEIVGAELQGNYVYVYQEVALEKAPECLLITNGIMLDVFRKQINTVNFKTPHGVRSAEFSEGATKAALGSAK